jgi:hypothetical protein
MGRGRVIAARAKSPAVDIFAQFAQLRTDVDALKAENVTLQNQNAVFKRRTALECQNVLARVADARLECMMLWLHFNWDTSKSPAAPLVGENFWMEVDLVYKGSDRDTLRKRAFAISMSKRAGPDARIMEIDEQYEVLFGLKQQRNKATHPKDASENQIVPTCDEARSALADLTDLNLVTTKVSRVMSAYLCIPLHISLLHSTCCSCTREHACMHA